MVEACGLLPIFLFLMMAMAGAFRFLQLEESLYYSGFEQIRRCSVEMSYDYSSARIGRLYLEHRIMDQTMDSMGKEQNDWIYLVGLNEGNLFFPQERWEPHGEFSCRIYCRWSVGNSGTMGAFSDELRFSGRGYGGENQKAVWIFPNWGECYHEGDCYVTGGERQRTVEDVAKELGYRPCQICLGISGSDGEEAL